MVAKTSIKMTEVGKFEQGETLTRGNRDVGNMYKNNLSEPLLGSAKRFSRAVRCKGYMVIKWNVHGETITIYQPFLGSAFQTIFPGKRCALDRSWSMVSHLEQGKLRQGRQGLKAGYVLLLRTWTKLGRNSAVHLWCRGNRLSPLHASPSATASAARGSEVGEGLAGA